MASIGKVSPEMLSRLQADPAHTRNICILAHVDHGKTTLTDCLISSNGIISAKLAGRVRYMDSTDEEQARGITMKSSAIALLHHDEPQRELRVKFRAQMEVRAKERTEWTAAAAAASSAAAATLGHAVTPDLAPAPLSVPYLVNLIDSPGHVDFSMDVATAARLCDGALVVVDALEGVCIQTHAVLRTAWAEGVRPVLVLNKVDRLISEVLMSPAEAFAALCRILEQANAIMSELLNADLIAGLQQQQAGAAGASPSSSEVISLDSGSGGGDGTDPSSFDAVAVNVDARAEAAIFFDPAKGNVVFASAGDGWAFTVDDFAGLLAPKLPGLPRHVLRRALWGDYFIKAVAPQGKGAPSTASPSPSTSAGGATALPRPTATIVTSTDTAAVAAAGGKPAAVTLMLERLWAVYAALQLQPDEARAAKIVASLGLAIPPRELAAARDPRARLQTVMRAWLPLHAAVLGTVTRCLPSPAEAQRIRLPKLWPAMASSLTLGAHGSEGAVPLLLPGGEGGGLSPAMSLAARLARVRAGIERCDASSDADVVVYVSKMFAVPTASLPAPPPPTRRQGAAVSSTTTTTTEAVPRSTPSDGDGGGGDDGDDGTTPSSSSAPSLPPSSVWWGMDPSLASTLDLRGINSASRQREARLRKHAKRRAAEGDDGGEKTPAATTTSASTDASEAAVGEAPPVGLIDGGDGDDEEGAADPSSVETFVAFARVFSGVLTPDSRVFVLGPKYSPADPSAGECAHISRVGHSLPLYMMMGRDLAPMVCAPAGSIVGIGRLATHVLKTATLCSTPACVSLSPMTFQTTPLVRVAIEPKYPRDQAAVERGLALLNQVRIRKGGKFEGENENGVGAVWVYDCIG